MRREVAVGAGARQHGGGRLGEPPIEPGREDRHEPGRVVVEPPLEPARVGGQAREQIELADVRDAEERGVAAGDLEFAPQVVVEHPPRVGRGL